MAMKCRPKISRIPKQISSTVWVLLVSRRCNRPIEFYLRSHGSVPNARGWCSWSRPRIRRTPRKISRRSRTSTRASVNAEDAEFSVCRTCGRDWNDRCSDGVVPAIHELDTTAIGRKRQTRFDVRASALRAAADHRSATGSVRPLRCRAIRGDDTKLTAFSRN